MLVRPKMSPYALLRPLLFRLEPETAHELALRFLRLLAHLRPLEATWRRRNLVVDPRLHQSLWGRSFTNPVGLAAGFDKNAVAAGAVRALGFGFAELGTVTPEGQPGNPPPRLLRLARQESLQNWLGFNNQGIEVVRRNLARVYPAPLPLGINLGKNSATPPAQALDDYRQLLKGLGDLCDYVVVNVSSPNTPGLRQLQSEAFLRPLLTEARQLTSKPVLVKISPDLEEAEAVELCARAVEAGASGILATNTTTDYSLLPDRAQRRGGLSGRVLRQRSFRLLEALGRELWDKTVLVSVGGIDSGDEAYRRIRAGASLVELYTALVYHGPGLVRSINRDLRHLLERDGFFALGEAVGADRRGATTAPAPSPVEGPS